jgi:hypothetical protein
VVHAPTQRGLTLALGAAMKILASIATLLVLAGCTQASHPTPAELAGSPNSYHDRQIRTCGQITVGGGSCHLKAETTEIWLSSSSELCQRPSVSTTYANITGLFSALEKEHLVIRKADVTPVLGGCSSGDT